MSTRPGGEQPQEPDKVTGLLSDILDELRDLNGKLSRPAQRDRVYLEEPAPVRERP